MQQRHPDRFRSVLTRIADKIPGIHRIDTERTPDGPFAAALQRPRLRRPVLRSANVGRRTLKLFALPAVAGRSRSAAVPVHRGAGERSLPQAARGAGPGVSCPRHRTGAGLTGLRDHPSTLSCRCARSRRGLDTREGRGWLRQHQTRQRRSDDRQHGWRRGFPWADCGTATIWIRGDRVHFEILVEDQSGKKFLDAIVPKMIGPEDSVRVKPYRGIGRVPKDLKPATDPRKRILLDQLPRLLQGYGKNVRRLRSRLPGDGHRRVRSRRPMPEGVSDRARRGSGRLCTEAERQLLLRDRRRGRRGCLATCPRSARHTHGRGRRSSTPTRTISICGTWEVLADAVYPGGASALSSKGWQTVGMEKSRWAESISPFMEIGSNRSPRLPLLPGDGSYLWPRPWADRTDGRRREEAARPAVLSDAIDAAWRERRYVYRRRA